MRTLRTEFCTFTFAAVCSLFAAAGSMAQQPMEEPVSPGVRGVMAAAGEAAPGEIAVNAYEHYFVPPHQARILAELESTGATAAQARQTVEQAAAKLAEAVKNTAAGASFAMRRETFASAGQSGAITAGTAVKVHRTFAVETGEQDKVSALIDQLVRAGASISSVEPLPASLDKAHSDAVKKASEKARAKAELVASSLGAKLGGVLSAAVSEEPSGQALRQGFERGADVLRTGDFDMVVSITVRFAIAD